jgi:AcrR family transcriptional regulator
MAGGLEGVGRLTQKIRDAGPGGTMTKLESAVDPRVERTREALFAAAIQLVENRDVSEISIKDLAETAGVSRQAIYAHFPDRDHLLADTAVRRMSKSIAEAQDGTTYLPEDGSAPRTLVALISHLMEQSTFYRRIFTGPTSALAIAELSRQNHSHFERLMDLPAVPPRKGGARDVAEPDLIEFLAGGSTALTVRWIIDPPSDLPEVLANRLWSVWMTLRPTSPASA